MTGRHERRDDGDPVSNQSMSRFENRYRRLLRLLPASYRDVREDEMVSTYMSRNLEGAQDDDVEILQECGRPNRSESVAIIGLALRLRWADPTGPIRFRVRAGAVRWATLASLAVLAILAARGILGNILATLGSQLLPADMDGHPYWHPLDFSNALQEWAYLGWIPAFILAARGGRPGTKLAATFALIPVSVSMVSSTVVPLISSSTRFSAPALTWAVVQGAVLLGLAATASGQQEQRNHDRLSWHLVASFGFVGVVLLGGAALLFNHRIPDPLAVLVDISTSDTGLWSWAVLVAAGSLLAQNARHKSVSISQVLGLFGLGLLALALTVSFLAVLTQTGSGVPTLITAFFAVQLGILLAITSSAAALAAKRIRHLPPVQYSLVEPEIVAPE